MAAMEDPLYAGSYQWKRARQGWSLAGLSSRRFWTNSLVKYFHQGYRSESPEKTLALRFRDSPDLSPVR